MRDDVFDDVRVADDLEIETPTAVNASLPLVVRLVVFLGVERWVLQVMDEKSGLLVESPADRRRQLVQRFERSLRVLQRHRAGLAFLRTARSFLILASIEAAISSAVLKGP